MSDDFSLPSSELSSSKHLIKRFDDDMQAVHSQMNLLKIVFDNLKGSWTAISLVHKAIKIDIEDKN
ncbi:MAG: hypothetical protein Q8T08_20365 [Ignavibacteria bacterium]|nr:hypothetical protein [Ignavibacteria bacterium]